MSLEWGVGTITWAGDWRLTLLGVVVICIIVISYTIETYFECENGEKKKSEGDPEDTATLLGSTGDPIKATATSEGTSIHERKPPVSNSYAFFSGLAVLLCSVSLVYTNAWVLARYSHVAMYITIQQGAGFMMALILVKCLHYVEPIELNWTVYFTRVAPLGVCFTVYLWGSNTAYKYLQPGLIQMIKPLGSAYVFLIACFLGLERYSRAKALNFALICCGTMLTAAPELLRGVGGVDGSTSAKITFGVCTLIAAYFFDAYYVVGIQRLQEGDVLTRPFDPLSTLFYVSPIACVCLGIVSLCTEPGAIADIPDVNPSLFVLSSCLAFSFNLAVMNFIGRLSATTYVIFDYFKDIIILSVAFFLFSEHFARNELIGYAAVVLGGCTWQHRKLRHLAYAQHHINAKFRARAQKAAASSTPSASTSGLFHREDFVPKDDAASSAVSCAARDRNSSAAPPNPHTGDTRDLIDL